MINEIKHLFPTAIPMEDFEIRDDSNGKGAFITKWNTAKLGVQPTPSQLSAVKAVADTAVANKSSNDLINAELLAADLKIIRALSEGDNLRIAAFRDSQAALRLKLKP